MIKKEITFIYSDIVQKQIFQMIAEVAQKRGYKYQLTNDPFAKCEIGWYCDHINFPQFSKFSIIMLHDIMQQFGNWPDIWLREPWNKYDIGFLPSKVWADNWRQCSKWYYTNPKKGVYLTGWPKADRLSLYMDKSLKEEHIKEVGLDPNKPTVLYAPAWENDHKQDEFVQAMMQLDVNILIKQVPWPDSYVEQIDNINEMYELHKSNPRVIILDRMSSILDAIMISDVLVSEESSTMSEAVMLGKPAISVNDWMIPDVTPSRFPANNYDYVIRTNKAQLTQCVAEVIADYEYYQKQAQTYSESHYTNIGKCIPMMLDILDAVIEHHDSPYPALTPKKKERLRIKQYGIHKMTIIKREIADNYAIRNPLIRKIYTGYRKLKHN